MKTIEQAAKEFRAEFMADGSHLERCSDVSFKAGVEFAQRWIPVEEELPEENEVVLVKGVIYSLALYKGGKFNPDFMLKHEDVTHWRPIKLK